MEFFGETVTDIPDEFQQNSSALLWNIYPNPFTEQTTISFTLTEEAPISIEVFNINGKKVETLLNKKLKDGTYSVQWDGTDNRGTKLNSGIYLISLKTETATSIKKVMRY